MNDILSRIKKYDEYSNIVDEYINIKNFYTKRINKLENNDLTLHNDNKKCNKCNSMSIYTNNNNEYLCWTHSIKY